MKVEFRKSFQKDLKKIKDSALLKKIKSTIEEIEIAETIQQINNLKFLKTEANYYRIRVSDYRIGIYIDKDLVRFIRVLHRKEIYKYFP
ncbi:type II toxin-antitoxin system RelE family toxin [Geminocystis sp. CENA526]|uniref:type II toxin-antitoxin system RelE family toxin n=1 Tax=Geminocystis sp. CENA526 TaxID=1355871 RepID=UPI003D6E2C27